MLTVCEQHSIPHTYLVGAFDKQHGGMLCCGCLAWASCLDGGTLRITASSGRGNILLLGLDNCPRLAGNAAIAGGGYRAMHPPGMLLHGTLLN